MRYWRLFLAFRRFTTRFVFIASTTIGIDFKNKTKTDAKQKKKFNIFDNNLFKLFNANNNQKS